MIKDEIAGALRAEWCVLITGKVMERPSGNENTNLPTGEIEIECKLLVVANGANNYFSRHISNIPIEKNHCCAGLRAYYKNVSGMDHENFIEIHFYKDFIPGYFWIFPLPNGEANVGVGMRSDVVGKNKINLKEINIKISKLRINSKVSMINNNLK